MASATLGNRTDEPLDTTVRLVTPERITFQYPLAGPFRRSLAYLLDACLLAAVFLAGSFVALLLSLPAASGAGIGLFLALFFFIWAGYGAVCESFFNGQTVGKMALGIRVVTDQGVPISGAQAFLRNLLWAFDGIYCAFIPAIICMVLTRRFQRLGDLAAGTMVMVETRPSRGGVARIKDVAMDKLLPWLPSRIEAGPEMARALSDYVKHRDRFGRERREEMAAHLADPLRVKYDLPPNAPGDAVLCAVYQRVFLGG
jgi:uncharacterized RDD family membrane protein YckC